MRGRDQLWRSKRQDIGQQKANSDDGSDHPGEAGGPRRNGDRASGIPKGQPRANRLAHRGPRRRGRRTSVANAERLIADEHIPGEFVELLGDVLAANGIGVTSVKLLEWEGTENGKLQARAREEGHEVMLTFDKDMADGTPPLIPVLIFDVVEAKDMLDTSKVLADVLLANEFDVPDYYPVATPRKTPSKALCNIALGLYAQNKHDGFVGKGFLRARWDTRNLDIEEAPHHASTRARMVYRRKQGLPMTEAKFRASRTR